MKAITNFKEVREAMGMSQYEVADSIGVHYTTVYGWERECRIQNRTLNEIQAFVDLYNEEHGTDLKLDIIDKPYKTVDIDTKAEQPQVEENQVTEEPVTEEAVEVPATIGETITQAVTDAEIRGYGLTQKLFHYFNTHGDSPLFIKFFGEGWTINDVLMNTDIDTMKQFLGECDQVFGIEPEDVVSKLFGDRWLDCAVLKNIDGVLTLYCKGRIIEGVEATEVRKRQAYKWAICGVK